MNRFFATLFLFLAIMNGALFIAWLSKHDTFHIVLSGVFCIVFCIMCINHIFAEIKK